MAETEIKTEPEHQKHNRPRKKLLYEKILKQMEFYFSDANLSKDRFLGELLKIDQYVPLEVFLKFNKLRVITQNIRDIAKSLKHSTLLEVSEDDLKVKRKIPLVPYNADERTVYVESIPVTVGLPWLKSVFEQYGPVAYISLPKFKKSQKIKGYAFVEYKSPEDAKKCMEEFTKMGCKLPTSMAPEELSTIKMFSVEESKQETAGKVPGSDGDLMDTDKEDNKVQVDRNELLELSNKKIVKASGDDTDETGEPRKKKRKKKNRKNSEKTKSEDESMTKEQKYNKEQEGCDAELTAESEVINTSKDEESEVDKQTPGNKPDEAKKSKPTRKRKAKERMKAKENANKEQAPEGAAWSLQVLSKQEWKTLRNKYLNIQWKRMKELKASLRAKRNLMQSETANTEHYSPSEKCQRIEEPIREPNVEMKSNCPEHIPGVLVAVNLPEPCIDIRGTKKIVRSNIHVQHVDVKEGQMRMVVRFNSSESAKQFTQSGVYEKSYVLCDSEEMEQWETIRAEYARKAVKGKPERGRDRLVARAINTVARENTTNTPNTPTQTKHIRFDGD